LHDLSLFGAVIAGSFKLPILLPETRALTPAAPTADDPAASGNIVFIGLVGT